MAEARLKEAEVEESRGPIFEPHTMLPSQFFTSIKGRSFVEGEKRLMAAVLGDAVECYMKQQDARDERGRQIFRDAEVWIFEAQESGLFCFRTICDTLGIEPDWVRRGLLGWRTRRVHAPRLRRAAG